MMNGLIMPLSFTGSGIQCQDAVPEKSLTFPVSSINKIRCRRARCEENPSPFFIEGETAPRIGAAICYAILKLPSVITEFPLLGYSMEYPFKFTCFCIVCTDIPWCRRIPFWDTRTHN